MYVCLFGSEPLPNSKTSLFPADIPVALVRGNARGERK